MLRQAVTVASLGLVSPSSVIAAPPKNVVYSGKIFNDLLAYLSHKKLSSKLVRSYPYPTKLMLMVFSFLCHPFSWRHRGSPPTPRPSLDASVTYYSDSESYLRTFYVAASGYFESQ